MKKILKLLVLASLTALILLTLASCDILFEDIPPVSIWGPEGNNPLKCSHIPVVDEAIAPTCTTSGRTEGQHCSRCKEVLVAQEVIEALGHTEVVDAAVAPTCTESGLTAGVHCSVCNKKLLAQEKIAALGHSIVIDAPVAPTCTEEGKSEGIHCSVCETVLVAQKPVEALGHTTYTVVAVEPTCTTDGVTAGEYCLDCGKVLAAPQTIPALGHTDVIVDAVAPTCTETGLTEGAYCSVCGETTKEQEVVDALGHTTVVDAAVAPTCTETGLTEGSHCSVCNEVFVAQEVVDALGHTEVIDRQRAPTCTNFGFTQGSHCSVCGETIVAQELIPKLGHNYVTDKAVAPTCTETGLTEGSHCSRCHKVNVAPQTVPATGHTAVTDAAVPATCTKTGLTEGSHCGVCGEVLVAQQPTPIVDHTPVTDAAVPATCTKTGLTEGSHCGVCGEVLVAQQPTPVVDHTPVVDAAVAPACIKTGLTEGSHCDVCGKVLVAQETIPNLGGHVLSFHAAKNPTCTETGHKAYSACTRCDYTTRVEIPALGHNIVAHEAKAPDCTNVGNEAYEACTRCNYTTYVEIPALGHDEVAHEAKAPDCTNVGNEAYVTCTRCNYTTYVEIPALGHTDANSDYICDNGCKTIMAPEADSTLNLKQANALGLAHAKGTYTAGKYYITGVITSIANATYGNVYVQDAEGNTFYIYGLWSYDGKTRYDALATKPGVGDEITVWGVIGTYDTKSAQMKDGWIDDFVVCEHVYEETERIEATCETAGSITKVCSICKLNTITEKIPAGHKYENGKCSVCGQVETVIENVATFDFGANGNAAHVDGNAFGSTKSYTNDGYTLALTGLSKVYGPAYDAKGNSCIKLGTSSTVGSFSFTVPEDVTKVIIYVAKYKANTTKININGTEYTISGASNNGVYDAIEIDTTTTKTITFKTVSGGVRAMINTIEFYAEKEVGGEVCEHNYTETKVPATCTADGSITKVCSLCGETDIETLPMIAHTYVDGKCSGCELPQPDSTLTIPEANALGAKQESYTSGKYYVTGVVKSISNTTYGNLYIQDEAGNTLYIYGLYSADGKIRFDAMATKPAVGDTITVYGTVGQYNKTPQIQNGWMTTHTPAEDCEHVEETIPAVPATCTETGLTAGTKCSKCNDILTKQETVAALGHTTENGTCERCGEEITGAPAEPEVLATFNLGTNGSASHNDGSGSKATYSETADGYTLSITGGTNLYTGARDAKGNSALKLGTSKKTGSFTFTVDESVNKVVIYVAQYKTNTTKVTVNGQTYTITTASNNGAYTPIEIDTSTTKTVTFSTVSGALRAMVNTIEFWS